MPTKRSRAEGISSGAKPWVRWGGWVRWVGGVRWAGGAGGAGKIEPCALFATYPACLPYRTYQAYLPYLPYPPFPPFSPSWR